MDAIAATPYSKLVTEDWLFPLLIVIGTAVAMELIAWAVHKYVMHGWGWGWHRSHHEPHAGALEKNDLYAVVFAFVSIGFFLLAELSAGLWWVGAGMLLYGLLYGFLHDGLVHRRLPFMPTPRSGYLKRLVQAHRMHHAVHEREGAVSFGFLYAPPVARLKRELAAQGKAR